MFTLSYVNGTGNTSLTVYVNVSGKDLGAVCDCGTATASADASGKTDGATAELQGNTKVADPIDPGTGNMFESATDYSTVGQNTLSFTRYYNSRAVPTSFAHSFGIGWRSNYDRYIRMISPTSVAIERGDGKILQFILTGGAWICDSDEDYQLTQSGSTWTLTDNADNVESYANISASEAVLSSIRARNGYTQTLTRNPDHTLFAVTDSYNRQLVLAYQNGFVTSLTTADNQVISYGYANSFLTTIGYATTPATHITYTYLNNLLVGLSDETGQLFTSWGYDAQGRALFSKHGASSGSIDYVTVAYNADGTRTVTGSLGVAETYRFSVVNGLQKLGEIDRAATATTPAMSRYFYYDANGYLTQSIDWNGNQTTTLNNARGQPTQITEATNTNVQHVTSLVWMSSFHLPTTVYPPGFKHVYTYDAAGEVLTRTDTDLVDGNNSTYNTSRTWTYTWSNMLLASVQRPRTDLVSKTLFGYDSTGALTSVTDGMGHVTTITQHMPGGLPQTIVDPNGVVTTLAYDVRLRPTTTSVATSGGARTTTRGYDAAGNLTSLTLPDNSAIAYGYDTAHRLVTLADAAGDTTTLTLDNAGDVTASVTAPLSGPATASSAATYDALGRRLTLTPAGSGHATTWTWDNDGNALTVTDGLAHKTSFTWDQLNRLTAKTDPANTTFAYTYDAQNHLTTRNTPSGSQTYQWSAWGEFLKNQDSWANGRGYVATYNGDGDMTQRSDGNGSTINFTYDAADRRLTQTYPQDATKNVAFTYDQTGAGYAFGIGRLTSLTDPAGTLTRQYDEFGRTTSEARINAGHTYTTATTYDPAGRIAGMVYPSGLSLTYARNALGQVTGITSGASTIISSGTYLPFGPLKSLTYGNGVTETRGFDTSYRPTGVADTGSAALSSLSYTLDAADNVSSIADNVSSANNQSFTYDSLDRLLTATGPYGALSWTFNTSNARQTQTLGANPADTYTDGEVLNKIVSGSITTTMGYSGSTNLTGISPSSGAASSFTIDRGNRLASATIPGNAVETYTYDAFGNQFSRSLAGSPPTVTEYAYSQDGVLLEESTNAAAQADYIYLNGRPVAVYAPTTGTMSYLHTDRLGTPVLATNAAKATVWSASYRPYGEATITGSIRQNLRLPGQFAGQVSGWYHNGARDYNPAWGQYVELDPLGLFAGPHPFAYANDNPLKNIDPSGLESDGNLGGGYTGRTDTFNSGGQSSYETHVFDSGGNEVGVYGPSGWINKHGFTQPPKSP